MADHWIMRVVLAPALDFSWTRLGISQETSMARHMKSEFKHFCIGLWFIDHNKAILSGNTVVLKFDSSKEYTWSSLITVIVLLGRDFNVPLLKDAVKRKRGYPQRVGEKEAAILHSWALWKWQFQSLYPGEGMIHRPEKQQYGLWESLKVVVSIYLGSIYQSNFPKHL